MIVRGITMGHYFAYLQVWCWLILFKVMWFFVLVELQFKNECFSHICHMKAVSPRCVLVCECSVFF